MIRLFRFLLGFCLLSASASVLAAAPDFSPTSLLEALSVFQQGKGMAHPRLFKGQADFAGIVAAAKSERATGRKAMEAYLHRASVKSTDVSFPTMVANPNSAANLPGWFRQERVLEGMAEAALGWYLTRDVWYLGEFKARAGIFYPQIMSSQCKGEVTQTRAYAWYFALAYDLAFSALTTQEKTRFKEVIKACATSSLNSIVTTVRANPKDGIGFHALGKFVGALLIVLGEVPEANDWLKSALPLYVSNLSPWGGSDGGYANGTSYVHWDSSGSLLIWDLLDRVLGIPIYQKPWVAELPRFVAYTLPPGTPAGLFGDGAEVNRKEEWARFGKALMSRYPTPLARWYEKQLFGDDTARLNYLLSPRVPTNASAWPQGEPNSRAFPSVGWATMHSSMADRARISVYFKSSPYGSLTHSHGDQNSFVVYARARVLAMDSGYYDYYGSPHWKDWYKQTRAHNAITYDGGKGQILGGNTEGTNAPAGKIVQFVTSDEYDLVTGDATSAYGESVSLAKRTLVFMKPATLVVIDQLRSAQPRQWEWNLHTTEALIPSDQGFKVTVDGTEMCAIVAAPETLSTRTESGYSPMPQISTPVGSHYWNRFAYGAPKRSGLFVSVLKLDCSTPEANIAFDEVGATVDLGYRTISVTADKVVVQ